MNKVVKLMILAVLIAGCAGVKKREVQEPEIIVQQRDKDILNDLIIKFPDERKTPTGNLVLKVGMALLDTPYVGHTLEISDTEKLVINLRCLDCTTFAENCLAIARMLRLKNPGFEKFAEELQYIRYRDGIRDKYPSRLHYFSDWIFNNEKKRTVKDVSQEIAHTILPNRVNFMSAHPGGYIQLKNDTTLIPVIISQENEITLRIAHYIPKTKLAEFEEKLKDGDIIGITTTIKGMDVSHVGILVRQNGRIHMLHASSVLKKVVVSDETLEDYLLKSKSATGIMVARPL